MKFDWEITELCVNMFVISLQGHSISNISMIWILEFSLKWLKKTATRFQKTLVVWELLDLLMANFGAELSTRMLLAHYFQSRFHCLCIYCSSSPLFLPVHNTTLLSGTSIKTATFRMVIIFSKGNPIISINMMSMWCYSWVFITEFYLQTSSLRFL